MPAGGASSGGAASPLNGAALQQRRARTNGGFFFYRLQGLFQVVLVGALLLSATFVFFQQVGQELESTKLLLQNMTHEINTLQGRTVNELKVEQGIEQSLSHISSAEDERVTSVHALEQLVEKQNKLLANQQKDMQNFKNELLHDPRIHRASLPKLMRHGDPNEWRQRTFTHHSTYGFIKYSTYRTSMSHFATMAMAAYRLHDYRELEGCQWITADGSIISGILSLFFHGEHHDMRYETVVASCKLMQDTGQDGGFLVGTLDGEEIVLFNEDELTPFEPEQPFKHQLTLCGPPLYGHLDNPATLEWVEYNRVIVGVDFFHLYDAKGMNERLKAKLQPYVDAGMMEITDVSDVIPYDIWLYGQGLMIHDCVYSARRHSKWVALIDLDEYVEASPPHSIPSILRQHEDRPWITHQAEWWGLEKCTKRRGPHGYSVERMVFHWPKYVCHEPADKMYPDKGLCLKDTGHRKYFVNPRKVRLLSIHFILDPPIGGMDMHVTVLRHNHYQGVNVRGRTSYGKRFCNQTHEDDEEVEWWVRDYRVANLIGKVARCKFPDQSCVVQG